LGTRLARVRVHRYEIVLEQGVWQDGYGRSLREERGV